MRKHLFHLILICLLASSAYSQWIKQDVKTNASLRGLAVVNEKVIWASGTGGTVIRTIDGGKTWNVVVVPGAEKLDFRDIEAFDANTAYILSIGNGESSRIYKTTDGGTNWNLQFKNANPKAFFDAMACWDKNRCIAMSDPVDRHFLLLATLDGGSEWELQSTNRSPEAYDGEAAFAASGTCLVGLGFYHVYIVTGGKAARVIHGKTWNGGVLWATASTPFMQGPSGSGIFSIAMLNEKKGVIVGGDYEKPDDHEKNLAFTKDGGETWTLGTGLTGYRSSVTYVDKRTIIAVGTNGTDISRDGGETWNKTGNENLNAVAAKGQSSVWAAGPKGLVVKMK